MWSPVNASGSTTMLPNSFWTTHESPTLLPNTISIAQSERHAKPYPYPGHITNLKPCEGFQFHHVASLLFEVLHLTHKLCLTCCHLCTCLQQLDIKHITLLPSLCCSSANGQKECSFTAISVLLFRRAKDIFCHPCTNLQQWDIKHTTLLPFLCCFSAGGQKVFTAIPVLNFSSWKWSTPHYFHLCAALQQLDIKAMIQISVWRSDQLLWETSGGDW